MKYRNFGLILIFLGIVMLILLLINAMNTIDFLNRAVKTEAIVIDVDKRRIGESWSNFPVLQFVDLNEVQVWAYSKFSDSSLNIGDEVEIFYDPENPSNDVILENYDLWGHMLPHIVGCLISVILGSVFLVKAHKMNRK